MSTMTRDGDQEFVDLVRRMRKVQKKWFLDRYLQDLKKMQHLEREVDHWLDRDAGPKAAPTLFDKISPLSGQTSFFPGDESKGSGS